MRALLQRPVPGTGLGVGAFGALTLSSVLAFLVWGGPLWSAPPTASHVGRFAGSYLLVIPVAALALVVVDAWSPGHLVAAVGATWAIKMVVTSLLYLWLSAGTAADVAPPARVAAPTADAIRDREGDEADEAALAGGEADGPRVNASIEHGAILPARLEVPPGAILVLDNHDGELHTAELVRRGRALANVPVPPRASARLGPFPDGDTELRCASHPGERAVVHVSPRPEEASP